MLNSRFFLFLQKDTKQPNVLFDHVAYKISLYRERTLDNNPGFFFPYKIQKEAKFV